MELKEIIRGLVRESIKESISEMSQNDVHFKNIMRLYDHGGSFTKKKVAVAVCKNPNASRAKIIDYLMDTDYNEIIDIQDELNINETLVNEVAYDFGKKQYTDKNMTPTEILDLAMAYANEPITKLVGKSFGHRVYVANDLAKLTGTTQSDVKTRGKHPALILFLLKNELVSKEEYADLYKDLLAKQIQVIKYLKNSSPEMRNSSAAMRAAEKDGRGEFGESVEGDKIQNLNNRIKVLKDKISATKNSEQKSKFQNTLKNALQSLSNIKKDHGIKAPHNELNEAKFEVYHDSYTSAINAAREWAEKQGYTINDDDAFTKIGMGPRKPSEGKTNKFSIELSKDGKLQRKQLHIQVYGMKTKYELNCYIG